MMALSSIFDVIYTGRILPTAAYVGLLLLSFLVLSQNPRSTINRLFSLLALSAALWNVALFIVLGAGDAIAAESAWKLFGLSVLLLVPTWTYFALYFAGTRITPFLVYAPSIIFVPLVLMTNLVYTGVSQIGAYYIREGSGGLFVAYNIYILFYIIYGIVALFKVYETVTDIDKKRIKLMIAGIGTVVLAGTVDVLLALAHADALPIAPPISIVAVFLIGYSFMISGGGLE
ncbi:MAG: hypothetical protein HY366_03045 [Candidatus Aenigmarchaeota archaeon]|nr:hypothetical protein [Candidatus Aenigmarchaeota archaeon]